MSRSQITEPAGLGRSVKPVAISVSFGILFCAALLLLMSAIITMQDVPQSFIEPMAVFALAAGSLLAGYLCARVLRSNGLIYGAVCGVAITAIMLLAGLISGTGGLGLPAVFRTVFVMLSSMLGGVVGVNKRRKKR